MEEEETIQNKDPEFIGTTFQTVVGILQLYGWIILFVIFAAWYLRKKTQPWLHQRSQNDDLNSYKKLDSGTVQARLEAMERARLKMQAKHDEEARRFAERQREKEDEKRRQRIDDWERQRQGKSYGSKARKAPEELPTSAAAKSKPKKPLRPDYNPLMGGGSGGACYRPRRGAPSGGG